MSARPALNRSAPLRPARAALLLAVGGLLLLPASRAAAVQPLPAAQVPGQSSPARPFAVQSVPALPEAGPLRLLQVGGSVEALDRVWAEVKPAEQSGGPVSALSAGALRTGTGRAVLALPQGGTLTVGSGSLLRVNQRQPDLQAGRFFVSGDGSLYLGGAHLYAQGQVRLDAGGRLRRAAVIAGQLRVSRAGRTLTIRPGQQYDFLTGQVQTFSETDAWYLSRFVGVGEVSVQAARGTVECSEPGRTPASWQAAQLGRALGGGTLIRTGAGAWAELGFSGGGYLRLQADSQLRVLGLEQTSAGRQVLLQLESGSAWNVVQKGAGGYQITTPTVTTAVRGTVFRVDAAGLVKVFDGAVALPSQPGAVLGSQQQREVSGAVEVLRPDALDAFNQSLDAARADRTVLSITAPAVAGPLQLPDLKLSVSSNPGAVVTARISDQGKVQGGEQGGNDERSYTLSGDEGRYGLAQTLPEGRYTLTLRSERPGQSQELSQALVVDRTPPDVQISAVERRGGVLSIRGTISDNFSAQPLLRAVLNGQTYTLHVSGAFEWNLPLAHGADPGTLSLTAVDDAGNEGHALLP